MNDDYCIYRYVDDFILFAKDINTAEIIYKEINDHLGEYNLYLGDNKLKKYNRPFLTEKSDSIIKANLILKEMDENSSLKMKKDIMSIGSKKCKRFL